MNNQLPPDITVNGSRYRLTYRQCNKPKCKCHQGHPHGPYWIKDNCKYIGKELPKEIVKEYTEKMKHTETINKKIEHIQKLIEHEQRIIYKYNVSLSILTRYLKGLYLSKEEKTIINNELK